MHIPLDHHKTARTPLGKKSNVERYRATCFENNKPQWDKNLFSLSTEIYSARRFSHLLLHTRLFRFLQSKRLQHKERVFGFRKLLCHGKAPKTVRARSSHCTSTGYAMKIVNSIGVAHHNMAVANDSYELRYSIYNKWIHAEVENEKITPAVLTTVAENTQFFRHLNACPIRISDKVTRYC